MVTKEHVRYKYAKLLLKLTRQIQKPQFKKKKNQATF